LDGKLHRVRGLKASQDIRAGEVLVHVPSRLAILPNSSRVKSMLGPSLHSHLGAEDHLAVWFMLEQQNPVRISLILIIIESVCSGIILEALLLCHATAASAASILDCQ